MKGNKTGYGTPKPAKAFGQVSKVKSNNQCKKCKTNDARDTKHK